ncbi:hypothetical protein CYMTET_6084 [Cymbomonas tetramitiformis]|uniref:Uncharacterized protein n=1 Tax=Cymbomonas tetramitiformis TaxID=36881 RepID=A0AAE0GY53_9CHLO|nr:hypothetical protein CYMTET_6084 [Cymbomonas tetramitiformis]
MEIADQNRMESSTTKRVSHTQVHAEPSSESAPPVGAKPAERSKSRKSRGRERRVSGFWTRKMRVLKSKALKTSREKRSFAPILVLCMCTSCWAVASTFSENGANSGPDGSECTDQPTEGYFCICPRETVCATEWHEVIFLVLSRCSAYFDYPLYILLFLTKCHNLRGALYRTHLSEWLPLEDMHHLHTFAGAVVSVEVVWHSFWHLLRWGVAGDISFVWSHVTGRSGLVSLLLTPLIAWPMMFRRARRSIPFGYRKALHYLSVVWGISICFHAPKMHIAYIMGCAVGCYVLDWTVGYFMAIHFCPSLQMTRLGATAVEIAFEHPPGFINRGGGYVYICLPWLARSEWHAFSLYKHPTKKNCSSVCIARLGDWTKDLHAALARPGAHPGWIYGPFPSPFSGATSRPNLMAVASGIGVTPTLGTISQLAETHKVNVVWMCRDHDLIEYFMRSVQFDDDAWSIIFYTGKIPLLLDEDHFLRNPRLLIIEGRPALREDILGIMAAVESDSLLPKTLLDRAATMSHKIFGRSIAEHLRVVLERATTTYSMDDLYDLGMEYSFEGSRSAGASGLDGIVPLQNKGAAEIDGEQRLAHLCAEGVTVQGFECLVTELEKVSGISSRTEVQKSAMLAIFEQLDKNSNGALEFVEFEAAVNTLKGVVQDKEANSHEVDSPKESEKKPSVARMVMQKQQEAGLNYFKDWGIMYCGGAAPVVATLKQMHHDLGVSVKIESFDW